MRRGTPRPVNSVVLRQVLKVCGLLCVGLAVVGIFLPLLPTVPLLLLAAACFARSSERFHAWLLEHTYLGPMIRDYLDGQGIPLKAKISAIALMWAAIAISIYVVSVDWVRLLLIAIAAGVTIYLARLPLASENNSQTG